MIAIEKADSPGNNPKNDDAFTFYQILILVLRIAAPSDAPSARVFVALTMNPSSRRLIQYVGSVKLDNFSNPQLRQTVNAFCEMQEREVHTRWSVLDY